MVPALETDRLDVVADRGYFNAAYAAYRPEWYLGTAGLNQGVSSSELTNRRILE
jgi:hypothetical protein